MYNVWCTMYYVLCKKYNVLGIVVEIFLPLP